MKLMSRTLIAIALILFGANAMAIEEANYKILKSSGKFEFREYAPYIVAETIVDSDFENAGDIGFKRLFNYISGQNQSRTKIEMTAPVSQEAKGEKIAMTAPVSQQRYHEKWVVSFVMPGTYTMETLPKPNDAKVVLRQIPSQMIAAVRYSGFWSKKNYLRNKKELEKWISENGLKASREPVWARFDPPVMPWFFRRNEVQIPVAIDEQKRGD